MANLLGHYISNGGTIENANLTGEERNFYQNLSPSDRTKTDEILASTFKNLSSEDPESLLQPWMDAGDHRQIG